MPKFAISLQYLTKEVSDEVDFLRADKHESFLKSMMEFFARIVNILAVNYFRKKAPS